MTEFASQQHSTHASSSYSFFDDGDGDYDVTSAHNASSSSAAIVSPASDSGMTFSTLESRCLFEIIECGKL